MKVDFKRAFLFTATYAFSVLIVDQSVDFAWKSFLVFLVRITMQCCLVLSAMTLVEKNDK